MEKIADKSLREIEMGICMKKQFLGFLVLLAVMGCTEKVSEELSKPATSSSSSSSSSELYSMKLTNTKNENFSHLLHLAGDAASDCELGFTTIPDADDYDKTDRDLSADCILDVEESDLFFQGFDIKMNISEGLCEYVRVRPFAYWNYQPGKTNRVIFEVDCEDDACNPTLCGNTFSTYIDTNGDNVFDDHTTDTFSNMVDDTTIAKMCYFDHTNYPERYGVDGASSAPNCDIGSVKTVVLNLSGNTTDNTCASSLTVTSVNEDDCGGELRNCLEGPDDDFGFDLTTHSGTIYFNNSLSAVEKDYNITSPYDLGKGSNRILANYNRACAGSDDGVTTTVFVDPGIVNDTTQGTANTIFSSNNFAGYLTEIKQRTPNVQVTDGTTTINTTLAGTGAYNYGDGINGIDFENDGTIDAYAYATGPFRGIAGGAQPYYQFSCLDKAYDIRAQIRLFVREWDRQFNINTDSLAINAISDYYTADTVAKMDNGGTHDVDDLEDWNDFEDWDDFLLGDYGTTDTTPNYYVAPTATLESTMLNSNYQWYRYDASVPTNFADFTGITTTTNRVDNTCTEMSSPFDWRNFPRD